MTGTTAILLGIDCGLTNTKAVVFDTDGRPLGDGTVASGQHSPRPRWVERDMDSLWDATQGAVAGALSDAGVGASDVTAVGVTGHGDGVYLVDDAGKAVRPGINSLDSRATDVLERWESAGIMDGSLELLGQKPFAALSPALLAWLAEHEPDALERTRWFLYCKDWLRLKLTGEVATDFTEASAGFTEVRSQRYTDDVFALFGLEGLEHARPPMLGSTDVAGHVTGEAAEATGLAAGTPVIAGVHDVDASAIGAGVVRPGVVCAITGTWSINEVVSDAPTFDGRWGCRNFAVPGRWLCQAASPSSSTNLEWFVRQLGALETEGAQRRGESPFAFANREVQAVLDEESRVFYHPFLYGAPGGAPGAAAFLGLRGWHTRGHLLKALFEGVVFNARNHIGDLRSAFDVSEVRLTGGGSRSELWCQMYADALGLPVAVTDAAETGALGAAMCAGVGVGVYDSLDDAVERVTRVERIYDPDARRGGRLSEAAEVYNATVDALAPVSDRLG